MRFPLKLSIDRVPRRLRRFVPCIHNLRRLADGSWEPGEFSRHVSAVRIGPTWKSTSPGRQPISDAVISEVVEGLERPTLLDIGASDGATSLDLIQRLGATLGRCYVTDKAWEIEFRRMGSVAYFYDPDSKTCFARTSPWWVAYADTDGAGSFLSALTRRLIAGAPAYDPDRVERVSLCRPELRDLSARDERIVVCDYDIFEPWDREPAQIVKIANLLNPAYFSAAQIRSALGNLTRALDPGGVLVIVDNRHDPASHHGSVEGASRPVERVSVFRRSGDRLVLVREENGGAEAAALLNSGPR